MTTTETALLETIGDADKGEVVLKEAPWVNVLTFEDGRISVDKRKGLMPHQARTLAAALLETADRLEQAGPDVIRVLRTIEEAAGVACVDLDDDVTMAQALENARILGTHLSAPQAQRL